MNLRACILHLFPDARPGMDFTLIDHLDGEGPQIASWDYAAAPEPTMAQLQAVADDAETAARAGAVRGARDAALAATDWLVLRHNDEVAVGAAMSLSADQFKALQQYRQALRDLTGAEGFPAVDMPTAPEFI